MSANQKFTDQLEAVRGSWTDKIEKALQYDEEKDGLPSGNGIEPTQCEDPSWCPVLKSCAYHMALFATGCWPLGPEMQDDSTGQPVRSVMQKYSILQVLTRLAKKFDYVNYDDMNGVPDRDAARAHLPGTQGTTSNKRCQVCVNAAVKASFDNKVKSLIHTLLEEKKTLITVKKQGKPVRMEVNDSFSGLCLDCLIKTKFGNADADYWNHCREFKYDHGCTVRHSQPTWYFSYLGRPEDMKQFQKEMKAQQETWRHAGH